MYITYNACNINKPVREGAQNSNVSGCLCRYSLAKKLVPTYKNIWSLQSAPLTGR